jgi:hypothetical protein
VNAFLCQSVAHNKLGPKTLTCTDFHVKTPIVQIECKSCRRDRVDLTTCMNAFLCQSDAWNKLGPKILNVQRYPCRGPFLDF